MAQLNNIKTLTKAAKNGSVYTIHFDLVKGMEHVPNILMSFDKYLFLEVINILI